MKSLKANEPITIGYMRDDGDLQLLATLNNVDGVIDPITYLASAQTLVNTFKLSTGENIIALNRWDAPDYVYLDEEVSIDSNGYYMGDNLTPKQEQHNQDIDKQGEQYETNN